MQQKEIETSQYKTKSSSLITIPPDTIHKPPKRDYEETIFWSMLESMLKFTSTKAVKSVKKFTQARIIEDYHMYKRDMLGSGNDMKSSQMYTWYTSGQYK